VFFPLFAISITADKQNLPSGKYREILVLALRHLSSYHGVVQKSPINTARAFLTALYSPSTR
jgi:hypothetical protein